MTAPPEPARPDVQAAALSHLKAVERILAEAFPGAAYDHLREITASHLATVRMWVTEFHTRNPPPPTT
jgi:transcription elongation factor GreA-like protein